jgi:translation initiation factor IF-3
MLVRVKAAQKFLDKGDKVRIELLLRGREKAHPELAKKVIDRYIELLEREVVVEAPIGRMGGKFSTTIALKKK